jgi:predicted DNA binding CopG/RHH family protein
MNKPRKKVGLDAEEREILDAFESGAMDLQPVPPALVAAAKETMRKKRNINIRISEQDLEAIKLRAAREGLPYQTLIGSILHKYAAGYL